MLEVLPRSRRVMTLQEKAELLDMYYRLKSTAVVAAISDRCFISSADLWVPKAGEEANHQNYEKEGRREQYCSALLPNLGFSPAVKDTHLLSDTNLQTSQVSTEGRNSTHTSPLPQLWGRDQTRSELRYVLFATRCTKHPGTSISRAHLLVPAYTVALGPQTRP
nr:uncharacterized protein LOC105707650 [Aotus nancymaae]